MKANYLKKFIEYARPYSFQFLAIIILSILSVIFQVLIPIQIGRAVNEITRAGQIELAELTSHILLLLIFALIAALCQFIQSEATNRLTYSMTHTMRRDVFYHIHDLPLSTIDRKSHGNIMSIGVNDIDLVSSGLIQAFNSFFTGIATIIAVLVMMLSLNWKIAILVVLLTPISVVVSSFLANRNYKRLQEQLSLRGKLTGYTNEIVHNHELVKSLNYSERAKERFDQINQDLHDSGFWSQFYGAVIFPTTRLLNSMVYGVVAIAGAFSVLNGALSVGAFTSFLAYVNQYTRPFNEISNVINEMQSSLAAGERIFRFLDLAKEKPSRDNKTIEDIRAGIEIRDLEFSYSKDRELIKAFSLDVRPGDSVAIVGPTGAGKSTIINLLMRFYDQDSGLILIDGVDTLEMSRDYLRSKYGMVLQDSWIFEASVRDNIAYGKAHASDEEVIEAAKKANIHDMIMKMEDGYDSILEEAGSNISAGQQQLINIARIFLMDPHMLILDEATSSIDTLTEKRIQDAFDLMMEGRTSFIVAHRLSTIENADTIIYMENGQILEQGSHEELLANKSSYYKLYQSQYN